MTNADSMVFTPRLGTHRLGTARDRGSVETRLARARRKNGALKRAARVATAKRALARRKRRRRAKQQSAWRGLKSAKNGVRTLVRSGRIVGAVGGALGAVAGVAAVVATRLNSSRSFSGMGQAIAGSVLGEEDEKARAAMATRSQLTADTDLLRIVGQEGRINAQIASISKDIRAMHMRRERGETMFREDGGGIMSGGEFDVNGSMDMLILRSRDIFVEAWNNAGGEAAVDNLKSSLGAAHNISAKPGSTR